MASKDDIYEGYFIPKGALVITNIWCAIFPGEFFDGVVDAFPSHAGLCRKMSHDPAVYSDPFTFRPERFLGPEPEQDPRDLCFGFGRR